jgi:hypothetical protein
MTELGSLAPAYGSGLRETGCHSRMPASRLSLGIAKLARFIGLQQGGSPRAFRAWPSAWPSPLGPLGRTSDC